MENFDATRDRPGTTSETADALSSEATSQKTLSDIEEGQKDSSAAADDNSAVPSPDGQFEAADDDPKVEST
jgi:hypothetical protein